MKVLIVGSSGYISQCLFRRFDELSDVKTILKIGRNSEADAFLDLKEAEKFDYSYLDDVDYVMFVAAVSGPDQCANEFNASWKVNVAGSSYFIKKALEKGCRVLFFSSDAVFADAPGVIYTEESKTQPCTPYGRMKKAVEDEFKESALFKAIRLSYVASAKDRFTAYCLNCIRSGEVAEVFHPFYRNVVVVSDVVDIAVYFAKHWETYEPRFLNVAGRELVSRVRIADELNRLFDNKLKYTVSFPGESFFSNRPRITQMQSLYMSEYKIISNDSFTEKIAREWKGIKL